MHRKLFTWTLLATLAVAASGCGEDDIAGPVQIVQIQLSNANCGNLLVGGSCQLTVTVIGSDGEVYEDPPLRWVSENIVLATVSASGVVTGVNAGTAVIRVETFDGLVSDDTSVIVREPDDDDPPPI